MTYSLRTGGSKYRGVEAQTIGQELERIRKQNGGRLEPETVVNDAREPESPLHPTFTWDNEKAGEEYRKWEARMLTRAIVVVNRTTGEEHPVFVHVEVGGEQYYQNATVMTDQEFQSALVEGKRRLRAAQVSFDELKRLSSGKQLPLISATLTAIESAQHTAAQIA